MKDDKVGMAARLQAELGIKEVVLPQEAARTLGCLIDDLVGEYGRADDPRFLHCASYLGALLPDELRNAITDMRYLESVAALVVRGSPVAGEACPTPVHWRDRQPDATVRHDFWLDLLAAQLGDPVCWSSLQDGRLFNDVLPIAGEEDQQTGHGSRTVLQFHVEDCFSDDRCDALALLCLRNDEGVPCTIATAAALDLSALDLEVLFAPRFGIRPDPEHLRRTGAAPDHEPRMRPVLFGAPESPYLRVDPPYTEPASGDTRARLAFRDLCEQLSANLVELPLNAGDLLLVDNYRAVHGRGAFWARYDGTDRWMRKLTVVRDLRRTRSRRRAVDDRVIDACR